MASPEKPLAGFFDFTKLGERFGANKQYLRRGAVLGDFQISQFEISLSASSFCSRFIVVCGATNFPI